MKKKKKSKHFGIETGLHCMAVQLFRINALCLFSDLLISFISGSKEWCTSRK